MRTPTWLLVLCLPALLVLLACPPDPEPEPEPLDYPIVTAVSPEPDETNFFFQAQLFAEFNSVPTSASITLADAGGAAVSGESATTEGGRRIEFDPSADLASSASYTMTLTWEPTDQPPLEISFMTGPYGETLGEAAPGLADITYNIDLASATFVEPAGIGSLLGSQLDGVAVLFSVLPEPESSFESGGSGLHILGAIGEESGGNIEQEACTETLAFTFGPDGEFGGDDDVPASWNDPLMELGPTDLPLAIQGVEVTLQDLQISGTFHPELDDMRGGVFAGKIDTRPLAPALVSDGDENAICELAYETVGVECEECGGDIPGPFCLTLRAEDVVAFEVPDLELDATTCADLIDDFLATGECEGEVAEFDSDGDGSYDLCPSWGEDTGPGSR